MLDINLIRNDPEYVKNALKKQRDAVHETFSCPDE